MVQVSALILIGGWAVPVAFTGFLSQISYLLALMPWLKRVPTWSLSVVQGVLPQAILLVLTSLLPGAIRYMVERRGFPQIPTASLSVQRIYFSFLFSQVFLTVALSSSVTTIVVQVYQGIDSVPMVLARNLPKSSNYFISYLLLQALSMSAGTSRARSLEATPEGTVRLLPGLLNAGPDRDLIRRTRNTWSRGA